jgi:hypothetical protein
MALLIPFGARVAAAEDSPVVPKGHLQPLMAVSMNVALKPVAVARIEAGVRDSGAVPHRLSIPTIGMTAHSRDGRDLMRLGNRWRLPMSTVVAPLAYLAAVGGEQMAAVAGPGMVLMGESSAGLRDARAGDTIVLRDSRFRMRMFTIGAVVPDAFVEWGDLFISTESAAPLGVTSIARIAITGITSPALVLSKLRARGVVIGSTYRLRTSWDRKNPDGTLGAVTIKKRLGEFAYRPAGGSAIEIDMKWRVDNILYRHRFADIGLRNNYHRVVVDAIQGALSEIRQRGLARYVNVANANRYGGCFVGRINRFAGTFGSPSRHAYGAALDINTTENQQWTVPKMNCEIVFIFRKWGFAWGGNFWPSDGMHFEYVGEPRDAVGYPSRYCPNPVAVPTTTLPDFVGGNTSTTTTSSSSSSTSTSTTTTSTTQPPITSST